MVAVHYLKEGEEQKEVLEAKDDEEKESEVDGVRRESLNVRMKHGNGNGISWRSQGYDQAD